MLLSHFVLTAYYLGLPHCTRRVDDKGAPKVTLTVTFHPPPNIKPPPPNMKPPGVIEVLAEKITSLPHYCHRSSTHIDKHRKFLGGKIAEINFQISISIFLCKSSNIMSFRRESAVFSCHIGGQRRRKFWTLFIFFALRFFFQPHIKAPPPNVKPFPEALKISP